MTVRLDTDTVTSAARRRSLNRVGRPCASWRGMQAGARPLERRDVVGGKSPLSTFPQLLQLDGIGGWVQLQCPQRLVFLHRQVAAPLPLLEAPTVLPELPEAITSADREWHTSHFGQ